MLGFVDTHIYLSMHGLVNTPMGKLYTTASVWPILTLTSYIITDIGLYQSLYNPLHCILFYFFIYSLLGWRFNPSVQSIFYCVGFPFEGEVHIWYLVQFELSNIILRTFGYVLRSWSINLCLNKSIIWLNVRVTVLFTDIQYYSTSIIILL
jgi:hypothetical protein